MIVPTRAHLSKKYEAISEQHGLVGCGGTDFAGQHLYICHKTGRLFGEPMEGISLSSCL